MVIRMIRFTIRLAFLFLIPSFACTLNPAASSASTDLTYTVMKVVDGDTFWISDGSEKGVKVRLIGIDAPESRKTGKKEVGYFGKESKIFLTDMIEGKRVRLEYDVGRRDQFHRILAYAYLEDGTFINAELVKNGYAVVMTIAPNVRFAETFASAQREAREARRGLWKAR